MADSKFFADLFRIPFFSNADAKGIIVTDCKLDDALCLWNFFLLNLSRPAGHKVEIQVFIIGIQDLAGGKALVEHVFQEATAHAKKKIQKRPLATVEVAVYLSDVSKMPGPSEAPRHELVTYAPYHDHKPHFPEASHVGVKYFQDLNTNTEADFVGVICQFFMYGVLNNVAGERGPSFDAHMLDYIVPKAGGVLAFQFGFNTILRGSKHEQEALWDELKKKVSAVDAKIVFVNNIASFAKGEKKPGSVDPTSEAFVATLKEQSTELWEHLFQAGAMESSLFSCDQMTKWIVGIEPYNMEPSATLEGHLEECRKVLELGPSKSREEIGAKLKDMIRCGESGVKKVLAACTDLHRTVEETCGTEVAEYLRRAKVNLEKFGHSVEVTDGQHFMVLFQKKRPVLQPIKLTWTPVFKGCGIEFDGSDHDGVLWAAHDVDVAESITWMEQALDVPSAYALVSSQDALVLSSLFSAAAAALTEAGASGVDQLAPAALHCNVGVQCTKDLAVGDEVLRVPLQHCLTARVEDAPPSMRAALESVAPADDRSQGALHLRLCLRLWLEYLQPSSALLSSWLPLLHAAATQRSAASALRWTEEELGRCGMLSSVPRFTSLVRAELEALRETLCKVAETNADVCTRAPDSAEIEWLHLTCRAHALTIPDRLASERDSSVLCILPLLDMAHAAGNPAQGVLAELVTGTVIVSCKSAMHSGDQVLCMRQPSPNDELVVTSGNVTKDNVNQQAPLSMKFGRLRKEQLDVLKELGLERFLRADEDEQANVSIVLRGCDPFPNVAVVLARIMTGSEASPHLQKRVSPETSAIDRVWLPALLSALKSQLQAYPIREGGEDVADAADVIYDSTREVLKAAVGQLLEMTKCLLPE